MLDLGVGYVPEDRLHDGLVGSFSVAENLVLDLYDQPPFAHGLPTRPDADRAQNAIERVDEFDVRTSSIEHRRVHTLSGGNQQKVVLARELSRPLKLLIVAQPTRGLDVGSMEFVHRRIVAERDRGAAVVAGLHRAGRGARASPTGSASCTGARSRRGRPVAPSAERDRAADGRHGAGARGGVVSNTESDVAPASRASAPEPGAASDAAGPASTSLRETILVTVLAFVSAMVVGAVLIAIADGHPRAAMGYFFAYPWDTFAAAWQAVASAYLALFQGAMLGPGRSLGRATSRYLGPISDTLSTRRR